MTTQNQPEYWRWTEEKHINSKMDWKKAKIITAGVDVGSVSSKCAVLLDGELYCSGTTRTGASSADSAQRAVNYCLDQTDLKLENIHYIIGTGYGRVNIPMAKKTITEIACHGRGATYIYGPTARTVLDMGGQDCKAIRIDDKGKVETFLMNDKCAAGTGRGMEVFANLLEVPITQVGKMSLEIDEEPPPVSSVCVVYAKSEAVGLLRSGWTKNRVLAAYCSAMAHRVYTLLERIGVVKDFVITGGIAKNIGVVSRIEKELGLKALTPPPGVDTQIAGCVGAALFAKGMVEKGAK
ncbi:MAG: benzoyl-CoA reductase, bzd-type, subunit Q [Chloroflexi bacterium]|nr:benzoyl-CoA reductase, bzd-type, subunit Q [Chloroflexota bacterium]